MTRAPALSAENFREVMGHFATGVTVITASSDGAPIGTTASAVCSVSLEPPMVLACLHESSQTGQVIAATGRFAINILSQGQSDLAARLATKHPGKSAGVEFRSGITTVPVLGGALAYLECATTETALGGTHTIFIARVVNAAAAEGEPLAYFRGRFGRIELELD